MSKVIPLRPRRHCAARELLAPPVFPRPVSTPFGRVLEDGRVEVTLPAPGPIPEPPEHANEMELD